MKPAPSGSQSQSIISRLFGLRSSPAVQVTTPTPGDIVTPLDLVRQQATEAYEGMLKYIDEHGAEILEEDKKREEQFMIEQQKTSIVGFMGKLFGQEAPTAKEKGTSTDGKK